MDPIAGFGSIGIIGVIWYVVTSIRIYDFIRKRNLETNFIFLRVLILKYASQYRQITLKETGRAGPLFYHWIISINIALACAIILFLIKTT